LQLLESLELIGPGQWLDRPVVDQTLLLQQAELNHLSSQALHCHQQLLMLLDSSGLAAEADRLSKPGDPHGDSSQSPALAAALLAGTWLAELGVILQRWAGHRVSWANAMVVDTTNETGGQTATIRVLFETEDHSIAGATAELVLLLLNQALSPGRDTGSSPGQGQGADSGSDSGTDARLLESLPQKLAAYRNTAAARVLPWDAQILIEAATARDIPVCKLDREPYEPIVGDFRLRPNGLLRFGHACNQLVVDGTLCLERSSGILPQLKTRTQRLQALRVAGAPVTRFSRSEAGDMYRCFCAGQQLAAVLDAAGNDVSDLCHVSILECAAEIAQQIPAGLMVLEFLSRDITLSLEQTGGAFTGLDISPQLDQLLPAGGDLHRLLAADFVDWLFPDGQPTRIPLLSVTGTNGKTTTCRMLARIATEAGYRVGMACTDGIYLNSHLVDSGDFGGRDGHHRVLESREINFGVLETARGAVLHSGFSFDHSDVAVCTNVTPEHLGEYGIHTTEQMSDIKRLILSRARTAAVLNFDDLLSRGMAGNLSVPRICWTSGLQNPGDIFAAGQRADRILFIDQQQGAEWIMCWNKGKTEALTSVESIPATFNGTAKHNLSNAMQAIAAALELGIAWAVIKAAMTDFHMGIEATPGRLNIHSGPGFPVLLDFVQNIDGMRVLCEFVRAQPVTGKRILVMSVLGRHDNATVREFAHMAARNFDYFICRNYGKTYAHRSVEEIPLLLRDGLLEAGVSEQQIDIALDEPTALNRALEMGRPGDFVAMLCGIRPRDTWQMISDFAAQQSDKSAAGTTKRV